MLTGGTVDNTALEARRDVLVYTSDRLTEPLELIGPVSSELFVSSSLDHTDFFVRVCDVLPDVRSLNVCDGLQRLEPTTIRRDGAAREIPRACRDRTDRAGSSVGGTRGGSLR